MITVGIFLAAIISPGPMPLSLIPYVVAIWVVLGVAVMFMLFKNTKAQNM